MAPASQIAVPECAPECPGAIPSRQRDLISEMLLRLDDALADGAPLFAQQRMLSDLSVYASLLVRSRSLCSFQDAEFLHKLAALESALARRQCALHPAHLEEIKLWFTAQFTSSPSGQAVNCDSRPAAPASYGLNGS